MLVSYILFAALSYFLGSIPTGSLMARWHKNMDLTRYGSRRTGATNVLRVLGPVPAAVVFGVDFFKGTLAVALATWLGAGDSWAQMVAGIAAVIGHSYSVFIGFRGGRGVTTGLGGLTFVYPALAALALGVAILVIWLTRYVSLGSMLGTILGGVGLILIVLLANEPQAFLAYGLVGSSFILVMHRDNLVRLLRGTEPKLGDRV